MVMVIVLIAVGLVKSIVLFVGETVYVQNVEEMVKDIALSVKEKVRLTVIVAMDLGYTL